MVSTGDSGQGARLSETQRVAQFDLENIGFLRNHELGWRDPSSFWNFDTVTTSCDILDPQTKVMDFYYRLEKRVDL